MGPGQEDVERLRQEVDESGENLGEAVGAVAHKADVKHRGKEILQDKKETVMEKVDDLKSKLPGGGDESAGGAGDKVKDKLPSGGAVSEKADALKSKVPDADALKQKVPGGVSDAAGKVADKTPSKEDVKAKAQGAADAASQHPLAVTAGAAAAGLVAGLAVPETELERQKLKPHAQQARAELTGRVQETVEQVKSGAQDAAGSVAGAVKEQGQQQGGKIGDVAEKAADKTHEQVDPDS